MIELGPTKGDDMHTKEARSYVVFNDHELGLIVKGSHWQPGYTPAHCPTPEQALDYAIGQAERAMAGAQARVVELYDFKATMQDDER